jgi:hypothetical protein
VLEVLTVVKDVLIILCALALLIATGLAIYAVFQVLALIRTVRSDVPPILITVKETAGSVEGTVTFVNRHAVTPVIRGASIAAAVLRFLQVLFRGGGARRS